MPFKLSIIPASIQGYINKIFDEKLDIFVIIYLNNILIYTKDLRQTYVEVICWVFDEFRKYKLFTNLKKCWFYQNEVRFFGYIVSP